MDQENDPHVNHSDPHVDQNDPHKDHNDPHTDRSDPDENFFLQCGQVLTRKIRIWIKVSTFQYKIYDTKIFEFCFETSGNYEVKLLDLVTF